MNTMLAPESNPAQLDLGDLELWRDGPPHEVFTRLRAMPGLHWSPLDAFPGERGFWSVARYEDVATVGRDDDTAGLGMGVARVGNSARGLDGDTALYNPGVFSPVRSTETYLEATYQYQVMPWWQLQPDIQYVFNPGGGIANPYNPTQKIKDELVIGLRTNIAF